MGFLDKAKDKLNEIKDHGIDGKVGDTVAQGIDKASAAADKATGGKYSDKIDSVSDKLEGTVDRDGSAGTQGTATDAAPPAQAPKDEA
ncbi:antitoxin protein of toxin-antitoxin system [Antricoccus suffuscus]|uniref:Antitoxin protein of toxin-antitoxin system n=1 Tax=Antricoccus suffuscus TaxID=1629062 RepID=A0A2T0ZY99_9ACTN|nr:Rv0909 family putative TA system antitoxin [Antricoccus suffuscus]PRZ41217.1 antitoxin protein of toxin-antitoxin system [Antricoccus suffuscus]